MVKISFAEKSQEVDQGIRSLLARNPILGNISLTYQKDPSFFEALQVGNRQAKVLVAAEGDEIVGFQSVSSREVFVNGRKENIGYLSNLRLDKKYQQSGIFKRGINFLKENRHQLAVPFYFSSIISANKLVLKKLIKPRPDGLQFVSQGGYLTKAVILLNHKKKISGSYEIIRGSQNNLDEIILFLEAEGKKKNLFPCYNREDFNSDFLKDFKIEDFYLAVKDDRIVGMVGKWDQNNFKQNVIAGYSLAFKAFRSIYNAVGKVFHWPAIPAIGEKINFLYISFIAVADNDQKVFGDLLKAVYNDELKSKYLYLVLGLNERDPLIKALAGFICLTYRSEIFLNYWQWSELSELDKKIPYLEIATL